MKKKVKVDFNNECCDAVYKVKVDFNNECCDAVYCTNTLPKSVKVVLRAIVVLVSAAVIFAAGTYTGSKMATETLQQEAIRCGVGEYYLYDHLIGEVKFQFVNDAQ
jgi:hypothetical protein